MFVRLSFDDHCVNLIMKSTVMLNGVCCKRLAVNDYRKKAPSKRFVRVLNTHLDCSEWGSCKIKFV